MSISGIVKLTMDPVREKVPELNMGVPWGITGCPLIAPLSARLLPTGRRILDFIAHICISNIYDGRVPAEI